MYSQSCSTPHITYHTTFLCLSSVFVVHLDPSSSAVSIYNNVTAAELICDMAGYIPDGSALQWYRDNLLLQASSKYSFHMRDGSRLASKGLRTSSIEGVLTISQPSTSDGGEYKCEMLGHNLARTVRLTVRQGNNTHTYLLA